MAKSAAQGETDEMRLVRELTKFITVHLSEPRSDEAEFDLYWLDNHSEVIIETILLKSSEEPKVAALELSDAADEDAEEKTGRVKYVVRPTVGSTSERAKFVFFVEGRKEAGDDFEDFESSVEIPDSELLAAQQLIEKQLLLMTRGLYLFCFLEALQWTLMVWLFHGRS